MDHNAYVLQQPFPGSMSVGYQVICTCGVLGHFGDRETAADVLDAHTAAHRIPRNRSHIKDYITISEEPVTAADIEDLRRRQREIEEALSA